MSKILTLSVCLALALASTSGVALAGGHGGLMPSPQVVAAPQHVTPTAQGYVDHCAPAPKHCGLKLPHLSMPKICLPKISLPKIPPKCYEYEWVLKKKRVGGGLLGMLHHDKGCATDVVDYGHHDVYATGQGYVTPTAQYTGAVYGTGQAYGSGQAVPAAPGVMEPAPVETDEAPEAPVVPSAYGRLGSSLFGTTR